MATHQTPNERITAEIIKQLEGGVIPWTKPWVANPNGIISYATGKPYSSIRNRMLLGYAGEWATLNQIHKLGGRVPDSEIHNSSLVFFGDWIPKKEENPDGTHDKYFCLKAYRVFRVGSQTEGIEPKYREKWEGGGLPSEADAIMQVVRSYCDRTGVKLLVGGNEAFYNRSDDCIIVPGVGTFASLPHFWHTVFHELTHSTGHQNRLNLLHNGVFGDSDYALEELRADITACLCVGRVGLDTTTCITNTAAYVQSWRKHIKNFKPSDFSDVLFNAEKACDYIFNTQQSNNNKE